MTSLPAFDSFFRLRNACIRSDVHVSDPDSCNNEFAIKHFNNFQRALNVYSCNAYSKIWTCANCTDAYKRWLCSQVTLLSACSNVVNRQPRDGMRSMGGEGARWKRRWRLMAHGACSKADSLVRRGAIEGAGVQEDVPARHQDG